MKCNFTNSSLLDVDIFLSGFSLQTTLQTSCLLCKCTRTNSIIWSLKNKVVFTFPTLGLFMKWLTGQKQWKHISAQQKYVYFAFKSSTNWTGGWWLLMEVWGGVFPFREALSHINDVMCYWIWRLASRDWPVYCPTGTVTATLSHSTIMIGRLCHISIPSYCLSLLLHQFR